MISYPPAAGGLPENNSRNDAASSGNTAFVAVQNQHARLGAPFQAGILLANMPLATPEIGTLRHGVWQFRRTRLLNRRQYPNFPGRTLDAFQTGQPVCLLIESDDCQ